MVEEKRTPNLSPTFFAAPLKLVVHHAPTSSIASMTFFVETVARIVVV
ncbi:MAG TPA: hypothetical protein VG963_12445 [Polyangiaceae bacterium]|nr:hypothetical protein [Polyangiaceae bacterium]